MPQQQQLPGHYLARGPAPTLQPQQGQQGHPQATQYGFVNQPAPLQHHPQMPQMSQQQQSQQPQPQQPQLQQPLLPRYAQSSYPGQQVYFTYNVPRTTHAGSSSTPAVHIH